MTEPQDLVEGTDEHASAPDQPRVSFERLRERTDELELIISGISLVALVALPHWLFERWVVMQVHGDDARGAIIGIVFPLAIGLSYTLAAGFLLHLAARAYWVGLIGLTAAFPKGIRWDRVTSVGTITRDLYRSIIGDMDASIASIDRFASGVFALLSLIALSVIWISLVLVVLFGTSIGLGYLLGLPQRASSFFLAIFAAFVIGVPVLIMLLDFGWGWIGRGREPPASLQKIVVGLNEIQKFYLPQRLMLQVQLLLEANMPRRTFSIVFGSVILLTTFLGVTQLQIARKFAPFGSYDFMSETDASTGIRTAYYENLRSTDDALLQLPMIPADMLADAYLRVFLPHVPSRDNPLLENICSTATDAQVATETRRICLTQLWRLSLDDKPINGSSFELAERRDLGMRGLQGYVSTKGLALGRHVLIAEWNPDDKNVERRARATYRIPFWFSPLYQSERVPAHGAAAKTASTTGVLPNAGADNPVSEDRAAK